MNDTHYMIPEVVDIASAPKIAKDLARYIRTSPAPSLDAGRLREGGLPLMQILLAARWSAETEGKCLRLIAPEDGQLMRLLKAFGLEAAHCADEITYEPDLAPSSSESPDEKPGSATLKRN
ncbi:STAS domain-containing protein [Sagittula sp. NFXS13]|uniref:STAS domain-containing protein n=1 Tax=Sagittula sp. NFXS13 TaxID=2819095 RepID=UPI0032DEBCE0